MLHVVATLPIRPDKAADFEKVFTALAAKVRAEEKGCLRYDLCRSVESPSTYVVVETYADQDALKVHSSTPHFLEFIGKMQEFASGPPKIEMLHGAH